MEERPREWGSAGFELPPETEGWESKVEKAKEGSIAPDRPSTSQQPGVAQASIAQAQPSPMPVSSATSDLPVLSHAPLLDAGISEAELEKHSAEKAKQIIASTADDPYEQKERISQLKAEYMKVRFNKDIKLGKAA